MASLLRHSVFIKDVLLYALTSFGGAQGHLALLLRTFVKKRNYVSEEELLSYNAFCQMLPGPSSSQIITLIGYKRGGFLLSLITLLIWMTPACTAMIALGILMNYIPESTFIAKLFSILQAMSIGFVLYAGNLLTQSKIKNPATWIIMIVSIVLTIAFKSPWIFPILIITAGIITNMSRKRIIGKVTNAKPIKWGNLWLFAVVFLLLGIFSELSRTQNWQYKKQIQLSENFYRFGSTVFGGGQALLPMMLYQFDELPKKRNQQPIVTTHEIMNGYALIQIMPGPVFSLSGYVGSVAAKDQSVGIQILSGILAVVFIFLPSTLLIWFLFPIFQRVSQHIVILRAMEGINAAIIGIIFASGIIMFQAIKTDYNIYLQLLTIAITFLLLKFTKLSAPLVVFIGIIAGLAYAWLS